MDRILSSIGMVVSVLVAIQPLMLITRIVMGRFVRAADARQELRLYVPCNTQQQRVTTIKGEQKPWRP